MQSVISALRRGALALRKSDVFVLWKGFQLLITLLSMAAYVLALYGDKGYQTNMPDYVDWGIACCFGLDFVLNLLTAFDMRAFLLSTSSFTDLLALLPTVLEVAYRELGVPTSYINQRLIRLLRTVRCLRLLQLVNFWNMRPRSRTIASSVITIVNYLYMTASLLYFVEVVWYQVQPNLFFFDFVYFLVVTMTTVGLGDVVMLTVPGRAIAGVFVISVLIYLPTRFAEMDSVYGGFSKYNTRVVASKAAPHVIICGQIEGNLHAVRELLYELHHENWQLRAAFPSAPSSHVEKTFYDQRRIANSQFNVRSTVIMGPEDPSAEILAMLFSFPFSHRLKYVRGSPLDRHDLQRVACNEAVVVFFVTAHGTRAFSNDDSVSLALLTIRSTCPAVPLCVLSSTPSALYMLSNCDSHVLSISGEEMRSILLASNARVPGLSAFALNLLRSPLLPANFLTATKLEAWEEEYVQGCDAFLTTLTAPPFMDGHSFTNIAKAFYITYSEHSRLLVGVEELLAARGSAVAGRRLEQLRMALSRGLLTSEERQRAEYACSLEAASQNIPVPGQVLLNPGPNYRVREGQVLYILHGSIPESLVVNEALKLHTMDQQLGFDMKLGSEGRVEEEGYGFPTRVEEEGEGEEGEGAGAGTGAETGAHGGMGLASGEDVGGLKHPGTIASPPPSHSHHPPHPHPHHHHHHHHDGLIQVGEETLDPALLKGLYYRGQKNAIMAALSHSLSSSQYALPYKPTHTGEKHHAHNHWEPREIHGNPDAIALGHSHPTSGHVVILCDLLEAPLAVWPLRMRMPHPSTPSPTPSAGPSPSSKDYREAEWGVEHQGGEGGGGGLQPPIVVLCEDDPEAIRRDHRKGAAVDYLYRAGNIHLKVCRKIGKEAFREICAGGASVFILKPVSSRSGHAEGGYQDIVFTYITVQGLLGQCALPNTPPPRVIVDAPTLEEIEAMVQTLASSMRRDLQGQQHLHQQQQGGGGGGDILGFKARAEREKEARAAKYVLLNTMRQFLAWPFSSRTGARVTPTPTSSSSMETNGGAGVGGGGKGSSSSSGSLNPSHPPPTIKATIARRLRGVSTFLPPTLPYFSPLFISGLSTCHDSMGALLAVCFLEPASLSFLNALLLPWTSWNTRAAWTQGMGVGGGSSSSSSSSSGSGSGSSPAFKFSPTSPLSRAKKDGGGGEDVGGKTGEWGSASVELHPVPPSFHSAPFKRLFSDMLNKRSGPVIVLGILRSKHTLGAPADYPVIAPRPDFILNSLGNGPSIGGGGGGHNKGGGMELGGGGGTGDKMLTLALPMSNKFRGDLSK